jgi:hypothetical protein
LSSSAEVMIAGWPAPDQPRPSWCSRWAPISVAETVSDVLRRNPLEGSAAMIDGQKEASSRLFGRQRV